MLNIKGKKLSYKSYSSKSQKKMPTMVFLGGFMSDKNSTKANFLFEYCKKHDLNFVCFDYTGHGESSGNFLDGTISAWVEDSLDIINELTTGHLILVGSSMGGWISLLVTLKIPERIHAIIGIATSPDFTETLVWNKLTKEQQEEMMENGSVEILGGDSGEYKYTFTKKLVLDGRKNCLLNKSIRIKKPVVLLHGYQDKTVPVTASLKISELLESDNVRIMLSKNGNHRLSTDEDLAILEFAIHSNLR